MRATNEIISEVRRARVACALLGAFLFGSAGALAQDIGKVIALPDAPFVIPVPPPVVTEQRDEWYTYRYNNSRTGAQPYASVLSDPSKVGTLHCVWSFPPDGKCGSAAAEPPVPRGFKASPIVVNDTVFIGSLDGTFYALDAATGRPRWQYPPADAKRLLGGGKLRYGIESSASYWARPPNGAVIFGAQDPSIGPIDPTVNTAFGSARLFALDAWTGEVIWPSELIATINGDCTTNDDRKCNTSLTELHQRMFWSAPLIFNNKVYVGIHNFGDSPIQLGRVIAVDLATGRIDHSDHSFKFQAVGTPASPPKPVLHGGGIWNALAADGTGVYFTTGNTRIPWAVYPYCLPPDPSLPPNPKCPRPDEPEPSPNHGLSMIRVDKDTGNIVWKYQPVDFNHDGDPDWGAGATVMSTSCGELIASVQKDGWSYAIDAEHGPSCPLAGNSWQFPPTTKGCPFTDHLYVHGDDDYRRPGAAWNDVFIVRTGGENLVQDVKANYGKLHALNACATTERDRVRWIADLDDYILDPSCTNCITSGDNPYPGHCCRWHSLSAPTVTGGIVFIGTDKGHLVVLGDPSVVAPAGYICSNPDYLIGSDRPDGSSPCTRNGYSKVPKPQVLADIQMPDGIKMPDGRRLDGSLAAMRNEPVLAKGRVFVATHICNATVDTRCFNPMGGHVYMLQP